MLRAVLEPLGGQNHIAPPVKFNRFDGFSEIDGCFINVHTEQTIIGISLDIDEKSMNVCVPVKISSIDTATVLHFPSKLTELQQAVTATC